MPIVSACWSPRGSGHWSMALAADRIAVMTVGSPSAPALPLRLMRQCGVVVVSGSDGIQGTWEPWGNGDMLERAKYLAQRNGMASDEDLAEAARVCTFGGAEAIGIGGYGFSEGCIGDLMLVPARTLAEAVALTQKRTVIRRGRILVRSGELVGGLLPVERVRLNRGHAGVLSTACPGGKPRSGEGCRTCQTLPPGDAFTARVMRW